MRRLSWLVILLLAPLLSAVGGSMVTPARETGDRGSGWEFENSDVAVEPGYRFGQLGNGMRYVIRRNRTPRGTVQVRMDIAGGSLDEMEAERGFAHFVEHMAFNGSTHLAEGEMIRTLERHGLANGPDTNASTDFLNTTYRLDLPRNDAKLVGLSLMLMREIASELTFEPSAVERARGVVLSEMRDRNTWRRRNSMAEALFRHPEALFPRRFSIGTAETVGQASPQALRAFWRRVYVPAKVTMVVIGDIDPATVERGIKARFSSWSAPAALAQPDPGPVDPALSLREAIFVEPPISERVYASRHGAWIDGSDGIREQQERWLRRIAYGIVNRRFQRIARELAPPFRAAVLATDRVFRAGRTTTLAVDTVDGAWPAGMPAALAEYRRAMEFGFTADEVAEQIAGLRNRLEVAARTADTRSNKALTDAILDLLREGIVPAAPRDVLTRFIAFLPEITPERAHQALKRDVVPLTDPLLRFEGNRHPQGGEAAMRQAWNRAAAAPVEASAGVRSPAFAYTDFGAPGQVVSDTREPLYGIRKLRFANGVMLNLKRTRFERDRIAVQVNIDGGEMLNTRENPTVTQLVRVMPVGGLGKHTLDDLQSIRAGHSTGFAIGAATETFVANATTTPEDLRLQLALQAALIVDPGYRKQGEIEYRLNTNAYFNGLSSTPSSALRGAVGGILSDQDPRFTLLPVETYRVLTFDKLRKDIADRLAHGAIEVALVGDFDERAAIAAVASTFGALPPREADFRPYPEQRTRPFTIDRTRRVIRHTGPQDQALLRLTWPTRDDSDPGETLALELLERVVKIELTEALRQRLGKAYSPEAASEASRFWTGFGTFTIAVETGVEQIPPSREAVTATMAALRDKPVGTDVFERALRPLVERQENALKDNAGWMGLVDRAQTEPDRLDRYRQSTRRLLRLRPEDVQALARRYLTAEGAVEIVVLPEGVDPPR